MLTAKEILEWDDAGEAAMARPLLDIDGLSKSFVVKPAGWRTQVWRPWQRSNTSGPMSKPGLRPALDAVTFVVMPQTSASIVGAAGAGKSTLARLIVGELPPDAGSATRSCRVQLMPQDGATFFPSRQTIPHVIAAALAAQQRDRNTALALAGSLLERVGLTPGLFAGETMARLSKGQRQRVAVALALIGEPQLIILDEPTAGLDAIAAAPLIELLHDLRLERDLTYLVLTRDIGIAKALGGSNMMTLIDGRLDANESRGVI
jgi:peptide/nickel transport system ATP-binding protein